MENEIASNPLSDEVVSTINSSTDVNSQKVQVDNAISAQHDDE